MRSNCCFDSNSTTRRVSCKKGSISSAAQTQAIVVVVMRCRGVQRSKVSGQGVGRWRHRFGKYADFAIHKTTVGLRFRSCETISSQSSLTLVAPESQACMIWRTVELNASLTFSYSRSIFLFSWVVQSVNCFSHFSF